MKFKTITVFPLFLVLSLFKGYTEGGPSSIRVIIEKDNEEKFAVNAPIKREIELLETQIMKDVVKEEEDMFPSEDIYSSWSNDFVNAYKNVQIPDSFQIDCSKYVAPCEGYITSRYGPRRYRMHQGIDLKVQVGDTIVAAFDGKVRIKKFQNKGYGNYLVIRHNNGLETVYGHLLKSLVEENNIVKAGQPIALGGNTGRSTGSHLHFETRFLGIAINPEEIIDFKNFVTHKDVYTFQKAKTTPLIYGTPTSEGIVYHRIKSGESLSVVAKKYGTSVSALCRLNKLTTTSILRIGQLIRCN